MRFSSCLLFALAMGLTCLTTLRNSARHAPMRLTRGLAYSLLMGITHALMLLGGMWLASLWRFQAGSLDTYVFVGIMLLLAAKLALGLFDKKNAEAAYDIARPSTFLLLCIALGINSLIGGMALGFLTTLPQGWLMASLPLLLLVLLLSYVGIMLGRRDIAIRQRRWGLFSILFLLVTVFVNLL